ncbi:hypothetical protein RF11_08947 [Thelohanellus kitauei]|uniref:PDZ domain-containing protein n=1 Tax=Thelohanellus kitauei TaxID=669202 RepID=A0A0C2MMB0_THEKT|nr:hypothetical protein RF11_08947 [Thelohanellus kitauei]
MKDSSTSVDESLSDDSTSLDLPNRCRYDPHETLLMRSQDKTRLNFSMNRLNKIDEIDGFIGLSLTKSSQSDHPALCVKEVIPQSSAFFDGRIVKGDEIAMINNQRVSEMNLQDVCKLIKYSKHGIILGIVRHDICDDKSNLNTELSYDKYHLELPLGFSLEDLGLIVDLCCGLNSESPIPSVFVIINTIEEGSFFAIMETTLPIYGQVIHSMMGILLEGVNEDLIIKNIKEGYVKSIEDGYFEMELKKNDDQVHNMVTILEYCSPSFFVHEEDLEVCFEDGSDDYSSDSSEYTHKPGSDEQNDFLLPLFDQDFYDSRDIQDTCWDSSKLDFGQGNRLIQSTPISQQQENYWKNDQNKHQNHIPTTSETHVIDNKFQFLINKKVKPRES